MASFPALRIVTLSLLTTAAGTGCRLIQTAAEVPAQAVRTVTPPKPEEPSVDPMEVQQNLMRFADEFTARMLIGIDKLRHNGEPLSTAESLRWKIAVGTATCSIASGQNAVASLLDMTVYVTELRLSLEEYWCPRVFGESGRPMLESCRSAEAEVWKAADRVAKPAQQIALREAIQVWHRENALPDSVLVVRAVGLASQVAHANRADGTKPGSVFSLLMLDPLAGLDPARRELAQTRMFAERLLFVAQKMPTLLRWQTELLSVNTLELPAAQQWSTNAASFASSAERITRVAEALPGQVAAEREALVHALETQSQTLTSLFREASQSFESGRRLAESLDVTLKSFEAVLVRLGVDGQPDASHTATNGIPFRIADYGEAAQRLEAAARELTQLLTTFDATLGANARTQLAAQLDPVVQAAQLRGERLVDYAFRKGLLALVAALACALLYRLLATLLTRRLGATDPAKRDAR